MDEAIDIAQLARQGVAVIVATRDRELRPQLSRAFGPSLSHDGARLTVCVEAAPDSQMARNLESGSPVVGGSAGGGFEWTAGPEAGALAGITALERDADGLITRITSVYDSRQLEPDRKASLLAASFAA